MRVHHLARIAALAAALCVCNAYAERQFRMGSPWPSSSTPHAGVIRFAQEVEKQSNGQMKVLVYPDSQLGDIQALVTAVQTGTVDMAYLGVANAGVLKGGAALNVVYVPYLFKNKPVVPEIVNGPLFQEMYDTLARESGVRIFASYGSRLPRAIDTVKGPIVKPADVKGMKIRVPPVEIIRATWEKLGAKPVVTGSRRHLHGNLARPDRRSGKRIRCTDRLQVVRGDQVLLVYGSGVRGRRVLRRTKNSGNRSPRRSASCSSGARRWEATR